MMKTPFIPKELKNVGFFNKILGKPEKSNALIEVNNLLVVSAPTQINIEQIEEIAQRYNINIHKHFKKEVLAMYEAFLRFVLRDKDLTQDEINNLSALKRLLSLSDPETHSVMDKVSKEIYHETYQEAISDGSISDEEKTFLEKLEKQLNLPLEISQKISAVVRKDFFNKKVAGIIEDKRISPEEQAELDMIAKNLNITVQMDSATKATLDKYRLFWVIENEEPPEVFADIKLQRLEKCYFDVSCQWHEYRKVRVGSGYTGPAMRVKIAKGLYWRVGAHALKSISRDELTLIDSGRLYLTNKRIIFVGARKSNTVRLESILDFELYKNGVFIQKATGKSPFLGFEEGVDVFSVILGRVLRDL